MRANPNDTFAPAPVFVPVASSITVTIGRGVGDAPMSDVQWARFQADVIDHVSALVKPGFTFSYFGEGEWNGIKEESAAILFGATAYTSREGDLAHILAGLAEKYGQEAIGYTHGPSKLAASRPVF